MCAPSSASTDLSRLVAVVGDAERIAIQARELLDGLVELVRLTEDDPQVRRTIDHRPERARRVSRVDAPVDEPTVLPPPDRFGAAVDPEPTRLPAHLGET